MGLGLTDSTSAPLWADPIDGHSPGALSVLSTMRILSEDSPLEGAVRAGAGWGVSVGGLCSSSHFVLVHTGGLFSQVALFPCGKGEPVALENHVCLSICLPELLPEDPPRGFYASLPKPLPPL